MTMTYTDTVRDELLAAAKQALDAVNRDMELLAPQTALPPEHLFEFEGSKIRVRPIYGRTLVLEWGPRHHNEETPGLDADPFVANGVGYQRLTVDFNADGEIIRTSTYFGRSLTDSAKKKLREYAPRVREAWLAEGYLAAWHAACRANDEHWKLSKERTAIENLIEAMEGSS